MTDPTPDQIAAALTAYDCHIGDAVPTFRVRFEAMRAALIALQEVSNESSTIHHHVPHQNAAY